MQNFYELSSAAQTAAYQLSELSNYVSEAAKMADSVRMVSNQMKSIYQTAEWNNMAYRLAKDARLCVPEYQLSNLAKNLAGQARANLNFTNQISALYGSAMESPAFRLSTEMLNSNVLNHHRTPNKQHYKSLLKCCGFCGSVRLDMERKYLQRKRIRNRAAGKYSSCSG